MALLACKRLARGLGASQHCKCTGSSHSALQGVMGQCFLFSSVFSFLSQTSAQAWLGMLLVPRQVSLQIRLVPTISSQPVGPVQAWDCPIVLPALLLFPAPWPAAPAGPGALPSWHPFLGAARSHAGAAYGAAGGGGAEHAISVGKSTRCSCVHWSSAAISSQMCTVGSSQPCTDTNPPGRGGWNPPALEPAALQTAAADSR